MSFPGPTEGFIVKVGEHRIAPSQQSISASNTATDVYCEVALMEFGRITVEQVCRQHYNSIREGRLAIAIRCNCTMRQEPNWEALLQITWRMRDWATFRRVTANADRISRQSLEVSTRRATRALALRSLGSKSLATCNGAFRSLGSVSIWPTSIGQPSATPRDSAHVHCP